METSKGATLLEQANLTTAESIIFKVANTLQEIPNQINLAFIDFNDTSTKKNIINNRNKTGSDKNNDLS
jgi:hypothetical protein